MWAISTIITKTKFYQIINSFSPNPKVYEKRAKRQNLENLEIINFHTNLIRRLRLIFFFFLHEIFIDNIYIYMTSLYLKKGRFLPKEYELSLRSHAVTVVIMLKSIVSNNTIKTSNG